MARHLHLDPFGGISGSQWLGLLIDLRATPEPIREVVEVLGLEADVEIEQRLLNGIPAYYVGLDVPDDAPRDYLGVRGALSELGLPERPQARALAVVDALARAAAAAEGVDVVTAQIPKAAETMLVAASVCVLVEDLGLASLSCGPVATGSGLNPEGGRMTPIPSPLAASLLTSFEPYPGEEKVDLAPVIGAALVAGLCKPARIHPGLLLDRYGHGAGGGQAIRTPHVLRGYIGERLSPLVRLEVTTSDGPDQLAYTLERLHHAGAVEAWVESVSTTRAHAASRIVAIGERKDEAEIRTALLRETSAVSLHASLIEVTEAFHRVQTVNTAFGEVPVRRKADWLTPDYEACAALAREHGVPIHRVFDAAKHAARRADPRAEAGGGGPRPPSPALRPPGA